MILKIHILSNNFHIFQKITFIKHIFLCMGHGKRRIAAERKLEEKAKNATTFSH